MLDTPVQAQRCVPALVEYEYNHLIVIASHWAEEAGGSSPPWGIQAYHVLKSIFFKKRFVPQVIM